LTFYKRFDEVYLSRFTEAEQLPGVTALRIHDEGDADDDAHRSLKNEDSRRNIPRTLR
jgi:hypothetical protein